MKQHKICQKMRKKSTTKKVLPNNSMSPRGFNHLGLVIEYFTLPKLTKHDMSVPVEPRFSITVMNHHVVAIIKACSINGNQTTSRPAISYPYSLIYSRHMFTGYGGLFHIHGR